jgi:hypothetical protein
MVDREEKDAAQKAKFIFLSVAALVVVLLLVSFVIANRARSERDALKVELEACRQDNVKLTQFLDDQTNDLDKLKKQIETLQAKAKTKAKPAAKSKTSAKSTTTTKKKTTKSR